MKKRYKNEILNKFNKEMIKACKADKILSKDLNLNLNDNLAKFSKIQIEIIDLIFNLEYINYIEKKLSQTSTNFSLNKIRKSIYHKFKFGLQILEKARASDNQILNNYLEAVKDCENLINKRDSFFKTGISIMFKNKSISPKHIIINPEEEEIFNHGIWIKIRTYFSKGLKFELNLPSNFLLSIIFVTVKEFL
jgi:hypothetical protein